MIAIFLSALLAGCEQAPPPVPGQLARTGEVISVVNGQNVTQDMLDAALAQLPDNVRDQVIARGQLDQVKEQVVMGELLYQKAIEAKLHEDPKVQATIAMAERSALAGALLEKTIEERSNDEAVKKWYDEHLVQFARPQAKARHILVKDKAEAEKILADVKGGADFAKVAAEKSVDKGSGQEGGELGWFEKNRMVPEFAEAVFAGEKGQIVGPVESKFGFHVIEIQDKRDAVPLEEAKDKIKAQLRNEIVETYIEELKNGATITTPGAAPAGAASVAPATVGTETKTAEAK